jgi:hypothetical protein
MKSHFVVFVIERKGPRERIFGPIHNDLGEFAAYTTKRGAMRKANELRKLYPDTEYRATGYWDKRPW